MPAASPCSTTPSPAIAIGALLTGPGHQRAEGHGRRRRQAEGAQARTCKLLWSSEDQWNKAFAAKRIRSSRSSGRARPCGRKRNFKLAVDFIVPKEGGIGWLDGLSIPATSTKKDAALAFINYMIDPASMIDWATNVGAPASANAAAMAALPADDLNKQIHKAEYLKSKLQCMSPLSDDQRDGVQRTSVAGDEGFLRFVPFDTCYWCGRLMAVSALPVLTDQTSAARGSRHHHQPTHTSAVSNGHWG
jgi:hypothetical protein